MRTPYLYLYGKECLENIDKIVHVDDNVICVMWKPHNLI